MAVFGGKMADPNPTTIEVEAGKRPSISEIYPNPQSVTALTEVALHSINSGINMLGLGNDQKLQTRTPKINCFNAGIEMINGEEPRICVIVKPCPINNTTLKRSRYAFHFFSL